MALVRAEEITQQTGLIASYDVAWVYPAVAVGLVVLHGVRAVLVSDAPAERWLAARGLGADARAVREVRGYLTRLRTARCLGSLAFLGLALVSLAVLEIPIGVISGPYLLSVLGAELLAPLPRQGRERVASLERRPSSYFAPRAAVRTVRVLLVSGILLAAVSTLLDRPVEALVHLALLVLGAATFEGCLRTIATRGLPLATADLARDTAVRVASSRTTTAAALFFASFGLVWSISLASSSAAAGGWLAFVLNLLVTLGVPSTVAVVIWLVQPVPSWPARRA